MAQHHAQPWIVLIYKTRYLMVFLLAAKTIVARKNNNILMMPLLHGPHYWYAVYYSSVEHRYAVNIDNLADIRQTAACTNNVKQALAVVLLCKVACTSGQAVGGNHLEDVRIIEECFKIIRQQRIWEIVIKQFTVEDATLRNQMSQTYVLIF